MIQCADMNKHAFSNYNRKAAFDAYIQYHINKDQSEEKQLDLLYKILPIISMVVKAKWNHVEPFMLDEIVEEAAIKLWHKVVEDGKFKPDKPSHLLSFCFSVTHNSICDTFRIKRRGDMSYYGELSMGIIDESADSKLDEKQIMKMLPDFVRGEVNRHCYYCNEHDEEGRDVEGACTFVLEEMLQSHDVPVSSISQRFKIADKFEAQSLKEHVVVMFRKALVDLRDKYRQSIYGYRNREYYIPSSDSSKSDSESGDGKSDFN
jgi:DNA-directed RNA polymerase specialized sigma24 family protein